MLVFQLLKMYTFISEIRSLNILQRLYFFAITFTEGSGLSPCTLHINIFSFRDGTTPWGPTPI